MLEQEKETSALKEKLAESDLKSVFKLVAFQFVCGWGRPGKKLSYQAENFVLSTSQYPFDLNAL